MHVEVETIYGRVRGWESDGIGIFQGIRYAQPPREEHRFQPPTPVKPWTGTFEATAPGPAAPQYSLSWFGFANAAAGPTGDDCLSLNVWTPGADDRRRPVLVWIHGGGLLVGAASTPMYDGTNLARRGDLVVVSMNYRLGAMGYAHLGLLDETGLAGATNLGVRDQIAALEWIRDNIARFGGDPDNVCVFGQSGGAMSIGALLGAPRARRLFHRAILQSGAADNVLERPVAEKVAKYFIRTLGGPPPTHRALGRIPIDKLLAAQQTTMSRLINLRHMMVFLPVVDGDVITEQPLDAVRAGKLRDKQIMVGSTLDEWRLFRLIDQGPFAMTERQLHARFEDALGHCYGNAPDTLHAVGEFRDALQSRGAGRRPGDVWIEFQSSRVMHVPGWRLAETQAAAGGDSYAYLFTWRPPAMRNALGACHAMCIPFVFGSIESPLAMAVRGFTQSASELSQKMQRSWIEFARSGSPAHSRLPDWERYCPSKRSSMVLGRECAAEDGPLERERRLLAAWETERTALGVAS